MASNELKIVLEDVKEKFDTVIEGISMVRKTLERHEQKNDEQFGKMDKEFLEIKRDIRELRQDLNDHRDNTELHTGGRERRLIRNNPPSRSNLKNTNYLPSHVICYRVSSSA
jgi:hypothetical protein